MTAEGQPFRLRAAPGAGGSAAGQAVPHLSALMDALPSGSYLTITHPTADFSPDEVAGAVAATEHRKP
ncbi:MAG: hypothetical protein ACRDN1_18840 [Trebonia sp.]